MNNVILAGRLVYDVELKNINKKTNVAEFVLAVKRDFAKDSDKQDTDFIRCTCFNKIAEYLVKYAQKGSRVLIQGNLHIDSIEYDDGFENYTKVIVNKLEIIDYIDDNTNKELENEKKGGTRAKRSRRG